MHQTSGGRRVFFGQVMPPAAGNANRWADRSNMIGICAICEIEHDLELLANGEEENTVWEEYLCPITGETFTHLHSPTPLAPDRAKRAAKSKPSASKRSKSGAAGKA